MRFNLSGIDRSIRWLVGLTIITFSVAYHNNTYILGMILAATTLAGFCPLYAVLGINTNSKHQPEPKAAPAPCLTSGARSRPV